MSEPRIIAGIHSVRNVLRHGADSIRDAWVDRQRRDKRLKEVLTELQHAGIPVTLLDIAPGELTPQEEAAGLPLESPAVRNRFVRTGFERRPAAMFAAHWPALERGVFARSGEALS